MKINKLFQSRRRLTNEIYQGIHHVCDENHQKVEGSITDEDVYGGDHPRIFKILPSAPQRQNENKGVRYQRGNPDRGLGSPSVFLYQIVLYVSVLTKDCAIARQYTALVKVSRLIRRPNGSRHYLQVWEAVGLLS